jgi:excisionase family DNA binding protein
MQIDPLPTIVLLFVVMKDDLPSLLVFTRAETQRLLRLGHTTVDKLVARGVLKSVKIGVSRRIVASSVFELLDKKEQK